MNQTSTPPPHSEPRPAGDPAQEPTLDGTAIASGPRTAAAAPAQSADGRTVARRHGTRWARISLILSLVALIGGMAVAALVGFSIAPQQAEAGPYFGDMPEGYQSLVTAALASFLLWGLTALAAMVTGVVALVRRELPGRAIAGLLIAFFAPAFWFAAFAIPAVIMAASLSGS
ncbi:hypothetical protein M3C58_09620 [Brachybacterium muris]|uniref:hypothetical protein n=1 Tax=Brachybacterium muris TaxID=219301 RepID=UPI0021A344E0|nr:hypothetical protein [Brachybacterium muris]MCT1998443.1 hypothetical protein [Brachybacterium muris]